MASTSAKTPAAGRAKSGKAARLAAADAPGGVPASGGGPDTSPDMGGDIGDESGIASAEMKLRDLLDRVAHVTGGKKGQVKVVVDAMLKEMGDALAGGQSLNLPGLGKLRVVRLPEAPAGAMTLKLRRILPGAGKPAAEPGAQPLAADGEDS